MPESVPIWETQPLSLEHPKGVQSAAKNDDSPPTYPYPRQDNSKRFVLWKYGMEGIQHPPKSGILRCAMFFVKHVNPIPKLRKAPQPPLSHPGATPDSDRAKKPRLAEPAATDEELNPGDRVEGLGNFGKPTGQLGTVEQANEDDAVVKWDDDGRKRLHQPWLKKV